MVWSISIALIMALKGILILLKISMPDKKNCTRKLLPARMRKLLECKRPGRIAGEEITGEK